MITLYTSPSPNGHKISIALAELELQYQLQEINLVAGEHQQADFLKLCPNGKIPVLTDSSTGVTLFESGAILLYLGSQYGKGRLLPPASQPAHWDVVKWLMFQMAGIGPMQGQSVIFYRYMEEKMPAAIQRYHHECQRLWGVVDRQLTDNEYLAGGEYSLADIAVYPWYRAHGWAGLELGKYQAVAAWADRLGEREAVQTGMAVPHKLNLDGLEGEALEALLSNARTLMVR